MQKLQSFFSLQPLKYCCIAAYINCIGIDFLPIICIASKTPTLVSPACWRFLFYKGDAEEGLLLQIDTAYPSLNEANFPYVVLCLLEKRQLV